MIYIFVIVALILLVYLISREKRKFNPDQSYLYTAVPDNMPNDTYWPKETFNNNYHFPIINMGMATFAELENGVKQHVRCTYTKPLTNLASINVLIIINNNGRYSYELKDVDKTLDGFTLELTVIGPTMPNSVIVEWTSYGY